MLATDDIEIGFDLEPFQAAFYESRARFPGAVMGWGTGKTLMLILRAITQSEVYTNNLGLIVRKKFTDLRDSTIKDFERYTGLKVPMSTKEITWPGTNSVIMFRHGDELSGLQNINLGWFAIEQAEEFDSGDEFDMLRGRMRRELKINPDFDTSGQYEGFLEWLKSKARRMGMVIANANGHNWVWRRWIKGIAGATDYDGHDVATDSNKANLPDDFLADLEAMSKDNPKRYRRYVLNSHDEMDIEGAYYGYRMAQLFKLGRITDVSYNPSLPVHVVMDPGYHTGILFFQPKGTDIAIINCYEIVGQGVQGIVGIFKEYAETYGYQYGDYFAPFDIDNNAHKSSSGKTMMETFADYSIHIKQLDVEHNCTEGRDRTEKFLASCWIDRTLCEIAIDAFSRYRAAKNETMSQENKPVFMDSPARGWELHLADTLRYLSLCAHLIGSNTRRLSVTQIRELNRKYA